MNPYKEARLTGHCRDEADYKFPHTWGRRKRMVTRNTRARLKAMTAKEVANERNGTHSEATASLR